MTSHLNTCCKQRLSWYGHIMEKSSETQHESCDFEGSELSSSCGSLPFKDGDFINSEDYDNGVEVAAGTQINPYQFEPNISNTDKSEVADEDDKRRKTRLIDGQFMVVTATVALLFLFSFIAIIIIPVLIERCQEGKDQEPLLICQLRILTDRWEREHQAANQYPSANNSLCPAADTSLASQNYSAADKWKWKSSDGEKCVIQLVFKDESSMEGTLSCHL